MNSRSQLLARRPLAFASVAALLLSSCTTPLYYAAPAPNSAPGAWTQAPGTSAAAGWGPPPSPWPGGAQTQGAYRAQSLEDAAWQAELASKGQDPRSVDASGTVESQAWGELPRVSFSGGARTVPPGSTGASAFGTSPSPDQPYVDAGGVTRVTPDGGPLQADAPGAVGTLGGVTRSIEPDGSGRPFLYELYQEARNERDALRTENESLLVMLTEREGELESMRADALGEGSRIAALESERDGLRDEIERLALEKEELEGRLLTAQIRRLEAEKELLEAWIHDELQAASAALVPMANGERSAESRPN